MNETETTDSTPLGMGVRTIKLRDQAPCCRIAINESLYDLSDVVAGKKVADIGCGYGRLRDIVESAGGEWVGIEPFDTPADAVRASAEDLPFEDGTFDVVVMDAVLEHIPDVSAAFAEAGRILKPGGLFVGYVAFMECFHEISYSHLSFKALEHMSDQNGMKLEAVGGGSRFGIDYHLNVIFYPLPVVWARPLVATCIRGLFRTKSFFGYLAMLVGRRQSHAEAKETATLFYQVECLRQSNGFDFMIRRNAA
jgi:SAM-dependent methyltransferase